MSCADTCEFMDKDMFINEVEKYMIDIFFSIVRSNYFYTFQIVFVPCYKLDE